MGKLTFEEAMSKAEAILTEEGIEAVDSYLENLSFYFREIVEPTTEKLETILYFLISMGDDLLRPSDR